MDIDIGELLTTMRAKACEAFSSVLQIDLVPEEPWSIVNRVENPCDFGATVGFANEAWQGACTLGVSSADAAILMPNLDEDMLFDALGEIGNTVCGLLSADPQFTALYGILEQTPPLFSRGGAWLARSTGVQGKLAMGDARVIFGCTVRTTGPRRNIAGSQPR